MRRGTFNLGSNASRETVFARFEDNGAVLLASAGNSERKLRLGPEQLAILKELLA